jgi:hypothetical protein
MGNFLHQFDHTIPETGQNKKAFRFEIKGLCVVERRAALPHKNTNQASLLLQPYRYAFTAAVWP